jgi:hypothetical protein
MASVISQHEEKLKNILPQFRTKSIFKAVAFFFFFGKLTVNVPKNFEQCCSHRYNKGNQFFIV